MVVGTVVWALKNLLFIKDYGVMFPKILPTYCLISKYRCVASHCALILDAGTVHRSGFCSGSTEGC